MNLVAFSLKTKGAHNFARRLWTVFARFGFSEAQTRRALHTIVEALRHHQAAPTFFIPAVVLRRHPRLISEVAHAGAEIGIHGYVHNDYRFLNEEEQYTQTRKATEVFEHSQIPFRGFRNPYLGWNDASLRVFSRLGFLYESNEAVHHDVIESEHLPALIRSGYEKSLRLFQAIPCDRYTLRPRFEGQLVRIPTSIPDDEMLFDRLRITDARRVGQIWGEIMHRVYELGGIYTLNLHPERGVLCKDALDILLATARQQHLPIWTARLDEVSQWWKERNEFRLQITAEGEQRWQVQALCSERATLLARHVVVEEAPTTVWDNHEMQIHATSCFIRAPRIPCIGLSPCTPQEVVTFLYEQGYPVSYCSPEEKDHYTLYLDLPEGIGSTPEKQFAFKRRLVQQIEELDGPFLHFGCWPMGQRAALSITGDIDSVTVQDFFLRILEVR